MARRQGNQSKEENGLERFFMKEVSQGMSVRSCEERLGVEAHRSQKFWTARTDGCHDGYHCRRNCLWKAWASLARSRTMGSNRLARSQRSTVELATNRPAGTEVNIEAQPGAAEAERRKRDRSELVTTKDETQLEGVREQRAKFDEASSAPASGADANEDDGIEEGGNSL